MTSNKDVDFEEYVEALEKRVDYLESCIWKRRSDAKCEDSQTEYWIRKAKSFEAALRKITECTCSCLGNNCVICIARKALEDV